MRRTLGTLAAIALAGLACEPGWLQQGGLRLIREISVGEGARLLEDPATRLIQVRGDDWTGVRVEGTALVAEQDPLPADLGERVVILAERVEQGVRMAARLSRAGIQDVAVVRGGVAAWQAARQADDPDPGPRSPVQVGEAT